LKWLLVVFVVVVELDPCIKVYLFEFLIEFKTIGIHHGERGEVCQVSTIDTEFNILEMEASLVQRKCMEASKGEAVMPLNLAKSKKNKMIDKARSVVIQWLGGKNL